jgi:hypothetical protein
MTVDERLSVDFTARFVMGFLEWELFHDKRRRITFYQRLSLDFIAGNRDCIY